MKENCLVEKSIIKTYADQIDIKKKNVIFWYFDINFVL